MDILEKIKQQLKELEEQALRNRFILNEIKGVICD